MTPPVAIVRNGHRTLLKWHRGKRHPGDTPFTARRIAEGMAAGASIEIDLQITGDGNLAVLHDELLEQSTTGSGPVAEAMADALKRACLLDVHGNDSGEPVMLLEDLARIVADTEPAAGALLQLDFKDELAAFHPNTATLFAETIAPVSRHMILSGGDAKAVRHLARLVPDLAVGYDPCLDGAMETAMESGDFESFTARALKIAPWASMFYLHIAIVLTAADSGCDMIGAFHKAGKTVDVWTLRDSSPKAVGWAERLLTLSADQITTDDADGLFAALA
ncbi:glycerophosphodiester phosphodiesterase [Martelella endophytica]|uniref:GP-PDE domain-containing protein n=1 Tax=Martelella endophytica TaxID=1486262 RepID=A0A0D5LPI6_MAREN|nr:glycerophosphodiester phosphodiesterase family protein [Martelella endophytica]AJY46036.1 hypothetical protein TM49_10715 [Martelella endophytica]